MAQQIVQAHQVRPGMVVMLQGLKWGVEHSYFDRAGGQDKQPRQIIICNAHPEDKRAAGGYAKGQHFGLLTSARVTVVGKG